MRCRTLSIDPAVSWFHQGLARAEMWPEWKDCALPASMAHPIPLWPLGVYVAAVLALVASMLVLSWLLGQRHTGQGTGEPYESGITPTGSARLRFAAEFYLVAMFFVIFDLEAVFIFVWAVAARELGWRGYLGLVVFIGVLVAALLYEWRTGALDWWARPRYGQPRPLAATALPSPDGAGAAARDQNA
jgi:NADH-quinone oxidoreductase subunit A